MLSVLQNHPPNTDDAPDFSYFIKHMVHQDENDDALTFHVADRETTIAFGGVTQIDQAPLVLSGTRKPI